MFAIFNRNSEPPTLETREDFNQAKNLAEAMAGYFPDEELLVLDPYGKDVYSTHIGAYWRYCKA